MTLQQLEYIVAVDKHRQFSKAAETCFVTQPALSTAIRKLEDELGVVIFNRVGTAVSVTEVGEVLLDRARRILFHTEQMFEIVKAQHEDIHGNINIGVDLSIAPFLLPRIIREINTNHPTLHLSVMEKSRFDLMELLSKGELDMAVMSLIEPTPLLYERPLYNENYVAYLSPKHHLCDHATIDTSDLTNEKVYGFLGTAKKSLEKIGYQKIELTEFAPCGLLTLINIVDEQDALMVAGELLQDCFREDRRQLIRPIVNPTISRTVSLYIHHDYVRGSMIKLIETAIRNVIPPHMVIDSAGSFPFKIIPL